MSQELTIPLGNGFKLRVPFGDVGSNGHHVGDVPHTAFGKKLKQKIGLCPFGSLTGHFLGNPELSGRLENPGFLGVDNEEGVVVVVLV